MPIKITEPPKPASQSRFLSPKPGDILITGENGKHLVLLQLEGNRQAVIHNTLNSHLPGYVGVWGSLLTSTWRIITDDVEIKL